VPHGEMSYKRRRAQVWVLGEETRKSASYFHGQLFRSATGISFLLINCAKLSEIHCVNVDLERISPLDDRLLVR
jgi:hypothetical protein